MKPHLTIIIASLALLIIIAVQHFLIRDLYELKKEKFDTEYSEAINEGLMILESRFGTNGLDTVYYLLDVFSLDVLDAYEMTSDDSLRGQLDKYVAESFEFKLSAYERISPFLRAHFKLSGLDTNFTAGFSFSEIILLGNEGEYSILKEDTDPRDNLPSWYNDAILANKYRVEGNFYRAEFNHFIDFTHKRRIIFREMMMALVLSVLSVVVVGMVFLYTIVAMLRQKKLSEMKTDFINNMTHELKTPLTTISVASASLAGGRVPDKEQVTELSGIIKNQNLRLGKLIDQILDINLWEKDQVSLKRKEIDAGSLLGELVEAFRIENKGTELSLIEDNRLKGVRLELDEFQFGIALHNLLSNAMKYGGEPPKIEIEAGEENDHIFVKVRDKGKGISYNEQSRLFEKFYRGKDAGKKKGLGLGLFYVKEIVELHGGKVEVFSRLGQGSTFVIRMPLVVEAEK